MDRLTRFEREALSSWRTEMALYAQGDLTAASQLVSPLEASDCDLQHTSGSICCPRPRGVACWHVEAGLRRTRRRRGEPAEKVPHRPRCFGRNPRK